MFSGIGQVVVVTVNSKYYHEHQRTFNIFMFTYLMTSKLILPSNGLWNN